jgi:hypothetical protein
LQSKNIEICHKTTLCRCLTQLIDRQKETRASCEGRVGTWLPG